MSSASAQPPSVCAAELAQRRLMECECLAAMYGPMAGDAGSSSFEVMNPDVERELRAAVDAWEASGDSVAAALTVRAVSAPLRVSLTLAVPSASGGDEPDEPAPSDPDRTPERGTVTLAASLPTNYPAAEAPALELSATHLSRDAVARVLRELRSLASERTVGQAPDGFECLSELAQAVADLSSAAAADDEARMKANDGGDGDTAGGDDEGHAHAVVRIDHMNDGKGYVKTLRRWSRELGVDARVFYERKSIPIRENNPEGSGRSSEGGPDGGLAGRVEGVYAVLGGDGDDVRTFLTRLRTEFVDVDARGARCKERNSTVLTLRRAGVVKPGEERVPEFDGFECEGYVGADGLEDALARFNLLHVGAGAQRFQPAG